MSMKDFISTLSEEQKAALLNALQGENDISIEPEPIKKNVKEETSRVITEDFTMRKESGIKNSKRKEPVKARQNTWTDTGEARNIVTPDIKRTPRERQPPKKVDVKCHVCGKEFSTDKRFVFGEYNRCDRCASKK